MKKNSFLNNGVTAHRGNSFRYPENTIAAFKSALEIGVDWIELDVRRTKDGQLVVIHDEDTGRVGNINLKISGTSYSELKKVDVAFQFRNSNNISASECPEMTLPLLSEIIGLIKTQGKTRMSIQPKDKVVGEIIELAGKMNALAWIGFNDGSLELMTEVKRFNRDLPVYWDTFDKEIVRDVGLAKANCFECVVMHESCVDEYSIGKLHEAGIAAGAWTVNSPEIIKRFFAIGIDRIYTDYPELCLQIKKNNPDIG